MKGDAFPRVRWFLRSMPIFWKIMGIGAVAALLFGTVTLLLSRSAMSRVHYSILADEARSVSLSLAAECKRPVLTGELFALKQRIDDAMESRPEIRYVIVRDPAGDVLVHTFERGVPEDLTRPPATPEHAEPVVVVFDSAEGLIIDCSAPILGGKAGTLELGITDFEVKRELASLTGSLTWGLVLCASVGALLALLFTFLITGPIRHLVEATHRIEQGDFEARAMIHSGDEIGRLSSAFNRMGESLRSYRLQVEEKERSRVSLIERIVHLQEDERSRISRELHDRIGQSLSALLLGVRSRCTCGSPGETGCGEIERGITELIEGVRRLAWDMRPPILDDYGLDSALSRYVEDIAKKAALEIHYEYVRQRDVGRAPGRVEVALYRVAQEALTNVVRHSGADRASVVVLHGPREIVLVVEDPGRGFDAEARLRDAPGSLGLTGMRERVGLLGGRLDLESAPGRGATVRVAIPLAEKQP